MHIVGIGSWGPISIPFTGQHMEPPTPREIAIEDSTPSRATYVLITGDIAIQGHKAPEIWCAPKYVGLKRTRNSNTDRSRRGRVAGLEWLCISSGSALEKANPFVEEGP
jgi:hypothetical protein